MEKARNLTDELERLKAAMQDLGDDPMDCCPDAIAILQADIKAAWQNAYFSGVADHCLKRYFNYHLSGLCLLLDHLQETGSPDSERHSKKAVFQGVISQLISDLYQQYRNYIDGNMALPLIYSGRFSQAIAGHAQQLKNQLHISALPKVLKDLLYAMIAENLNTPAGQTVTFNALEYTTVWLKRLAGIDLQTATAEACIQDLFLGINFNHLGYLAYFEHDLENKLEKANLAEQSSYLQRLRVNINLFINNQHPPYHPDWPSLPKMLLTVVDGKIAGLTEPAPYFGSAPAKLPLQLSVTQIALFIKLWYESGLLGDANLSQVFRFVSLHFSSKRQQHISAGSLSKEYYSTDQVTAAVVLDLLKKMSISINQHFFPG